MDTPIKTDALLRYYRGQNTAMQGALRAFWRSIASTGRPEGKPFSEALGVLHHERTTTGEPT